MTAIITESPTIPPDPNDPNPNQTPQPQPCALETSSKALTKEEDEAEEA